MKIKKMMDLNLKGKRVLIREDFNVPIKEGEITNDARIRAALPTISHALKSGARVMLMSHLGRPEEGSFDEAFSLAPVAIRLSELLKMEVPLVKNWLSEPLDSSQRIVLFENVRFHVGEKSNDESLAKKIAAVCDIYVMDAFATAHRAEASTCAVAQFVETACAGPLLSTEIESLEKILKNPKHPILAIVGGAKVSTKLALLDTLSKKVDQLIVGGGIANTFIAAAGHSVGRSLCEHELIDEAERLTQAARARGADIIIPNDVIVAERLLEDAESCLRIVSQIDDNEKIFDFGPDTTKKVVALIKKAGTVLWNGPVGAFEVPQFSQGTEAIAKAIAKSACFSAAGGGDTLSAIEKYQVADKIDYISTGGGAFLALLEGKALPAIVALQKAAEVK